MKTLKILALTFLCASIALADSDIEELKAATLTTCLTLEDSADTGTVFYSGSFQALRRRSTLLANQAPTALNAPNGTYDTQDFVEFCDLMDERFRQARTEVDEAKGKNISNAPACESELERLRAITITLCQRLKNTDTPLR